MTDSATALAVVQEGPRRLRNERFPLPEIGREDALLRVEACGICGTDYELYAGALPAPFPIIPGHEPVGVIEEIGEATARRWGVKRGDRVAVEALLPCGHCPSCIGGRYSLCRGRGALPTGYGLISTKTPPSLWGGYSQYLYLDPHSLVHSLSPDVPAELAVLFNPLGAGFRWAVDLPATGVGDTVAILGPGQRGLASVIASREAGAGCIIVTGLAADERKLALARRFGAHHTINVEAEDARSRLREITDGGADVVVDVTSYSLEAVTLAVDVARRGGTIVLAGTKGPKPVPDFLSDRVVIKELTIIGAFGVDYAAYEKAIRLIESDRYPLEEMHTHTLPLEEAERALRLLAREIPGEEAIHIALVP